MSYSLLFFNIKIIVIELVFFLLLSSLLLRGTIFVFDTIYISFILAVLLLAILFWNYRLEFFLEKKFILVLPFFLWAIITAIWSNHSFYSFSRAFYGLTLTSSIFFGVKKLQASNNNSIYNILTILNVLVIISCILSLLLEFPADAWVGTSANGFKGFFLHQNVLGAVLALTSFGTIYLYLKNNGLVKLRFGTLILINIFLLLSTYSRGAYFLFFFAVIHLLLTKYRKKAAFVVFGLGIIFSLILTNDDYYKTYFNFISKGYESIFSTRVGTYKYSLEGAKHGAFIGLGFGISYISNDVDSSIISENQYGVIRREKSSSILAIIEETGLIGLILFMIPFIYIFRRYFSKLFNNSKNINFFALFCGHILAALIVYAQIEAVLVGIASFRFIIFTLFTFTCFFPSYKET